MSLQDNSHRILIVGPRSPAVGGIASIVDSLVRGIGDRFTISLRDSSKAKSWIEELVRIVRLPVTLFVRCLFDKYERVLMFSSAYRSFWEKCLWSTLARMGGAKPTIVMVDGNYPIFFEKMSGVKKAGKGQRK